MAPDAEGHYEHIALQHPEGATPQALGFSHVVMENDRTDSLSMHSTAPLAQRPARPGVTYAVLPAGSPNSAEYQHDPFRATMPIPSQGSTPTNRRTNSWDLLSGIKKLEQDYEGFDSRNASQAHLQFADGDIPKNKLSRLYNYLLNVSIVTRWILFIVPVMGLLWIPGILGLTAFPRAHIWNVKLIWWSIWLSVLWGGWWAALATSRILPVLVRNTVGVVAVATRRYIDWLSALHRYIALFGWSLSIWVAFNPLIDKRSSGPTLSEVTLMGKILFALFLCAALLLFEKFAIQWIAGKFHERSYAERITDQKLAVRILVTLYAHSTDVPGRTDTMRDGPTHKRMTKDPRRFFKAALSGVRTVATSTTTVLGNVASEIAGSSVLQPNSPQAMVQTALASANKTRLLARRLYYSFKRSDRDYIEVDDIARFFKNPDDADRAFALFDKDSNGDASRDEVEMACLDCHREQLSIENSMRDLDSAVGRLDNILMSLYVVIAIIILAVALEAQLVNVITGAGTLILGLSWLIGGSLAEVLTSIVFLFIKHPYDVGDRVDIEKDGYTVKEIRLLSTIFVDKHGATVQAPNTILNGKFIQNIRRSTQMSESFEFHVLYSTTFEQIEALRDKMLAFVKAERRDFLPSFDVVVIDIPDQEKMILSADIKYKSNWQQGAVKVKRRNKWICALKTSLAELKIFGPSGDPDAVAGPTKYTEVPWSEVKVKEDKSKKVDVPSTEPRLSRTDYNFTDKNAAILDAEDVFGESSQLHMTSPRRGLDGSMSTVNTVTIATTLRMPEASATAGYYAYEMATSRPDHRGPSIV